MAVPSSPDSVERTLEERLAVPPAVLGVVRTLEDAGFETWTVGGAVRDGVLGHPGSDWDLATRARPRDVQRLFRRTVPVGIDHGTVGVLPRGGRLVEVTTFRRDVVPLGRRAVVEFADTIDEDLARRDFTINALAWHPLRLELRDPFDGLADLRGRRLRAVGDADQRFLEDHLRILRALRFAGRFRLTVDAETWDALVRRREATRDLSAERIREELLKIVGADPRPSRAFGLYRASGLLAALFPELDAAFASRGPGTWTHAVGLADRLSRRDPLLRLAPLLAPLHAWGGGESVVTFLTRLRFSNAETDRLVRLTRGAGALPAADVAGAARRRWLHRAGPEAAPLLAWSLAEARLAHDTDGTATRDAVARVCALRRELRARPVLTVGGLAVGGRDLIQRGLKPGPGFAPLLERLLEQVLDDPATNDRETLLRLVDTWTEGA